MRLAYNTNGLAHHDLIDAIELLAEIGYRGISITLDHGALNPFDDRLAGQLPKVSDTLAKLEFRCVVETGARFLLDPRQKHEPTMVSPDELGRQRRVDFLCRAIDIARSLKADCVSLWSGIVHDGATRDEAMQRLVPCLESVLAHAGQAGVPVAFEPEPGMLIDTLESYEKLVAALDPQLVARAMRLTIDIGHLHCLGELPIASKIRQFAPQLVNIHIEDMRYGKHEHLTFGDGEIDFLPVIAALQEIGYDGLLSVELSRHSHEGPTAARRAYEFLRPLLVSGGGAST